MKKQKGITLIALIITIIVMLILVGVSVTVALNGGLFSTAKQAADGTQIAVDAEKTLDNGRVKVDGVWYDSIEDYINKKPSENQTEGTTGGTETAGGWQQEGNEIKYVDANGTVTTTLSVGDKVAYDETDGTPLAYETDATKGTGASYTSGALVAGKYTIAGTGEGETAAGDLEWRVLGVNEEGQVELISTTPTTSTLYLDGKAGYQNAETVNGVLGTLDTFCNNIYGQGAGAASARSLTAEDINELGNYDPTTYSNYGTKYTYKYDAENDKVYGIASANITDENRDTVTEWTATSYSIFYSPDWTISSSNVGPYELQDTYYSYTVANELTDTTPDNVSWATIITKGEGGTSNVLQWLASLAVDCDEDFANFLVRYMGGGAVYGFTLYKFYGSGNGSSYAVRPVVSLESNIQLTENAEGVYEIN